MLPYNYISSYKSGATGQGSVKGEAAAWGSQKDQGGAFFGDKKQERAVQALENEHCGAKMLPAYSLSPQFAHPSRRPHTRKAAWLAGCPL